MNVLIRTTAISLATLAVACGGGNVGDNRTARTGNSTQVFPFNTISALRYDDDGDGAFDGRGSATVVAPNTALTCGHCVSGRGAGLWVTSASIIVAPGMYQDAATGQAVYPYGTRPVIHLHTNTKWQDPDYSPGANVDYGAVHFACPFEELNTFMPVVFDYRPTYVNMWGYPTDDLPDPTRRRDMWGGAGDVTEVSARRVMYNVRSTGGASGAPVWAYNPRDGRRLIAVNHGHQNDHAGNGPRMVSYNEDLIRLWMNYSPTTLERLAGGCASLTPARVPWTDLQAYYNANPTRRLSAAEVGVVERPAETAATPARRVMQVIGNTFYEWEEYAIDAPDPNAAHYLRLTAPTVEWLTQVQARTLKTASQSWQTVVPGAHRAIGPAGAERGIAQPVERGGASSADTTRDQDVGR